MATKYTDREIYELLRSIDHGHKPSNEEAEMLSGLQTLDLSGTSITSLPESIGQLTGLQTLDLRHTKITALPESIGQLVGLQTLDLSGTGITALPESIGQLAGLHRLNLSSTRITALPESIGQLAGLQTLNLSSTRITALPESIGQLAGLQTLDLSSTRITALPESIGQLAGLQTLDLSSTPITALPEPIGQLIGLHRLNLSITRITALPESIGQLTGLQELNLWDTNITTLPESIGQLTGLQALNLWGTNITTLPESIGQLTGLQALNLSSTGISALPESIGQLTGLQALGLMETSFTVLPPVIARLPGLRRLALGGCEALTELPDWFASLTQLQALDLSGTGLSALPAYMQAFTEMEELYLGAYGLIKFGSSLGGCGYGHGVPSRIAFLPEWLGALPALRFLDLSGMTIPGIPASLADCGLPFLDGSGIDHFHATGVNLHNVTLTEQDTSIFLEHPELIRTLYDQRETQVALRECRVIFLGDGASGKSYTIRRFLEEGRIETEENPYRTSETPGVEIRDYHVDRGEERFDIHFWDFGGQQLLHSMHRCFLSEESCYVVTVKSRETKATERARYWLRNVTAFAPKSPILLFVNCWENDDGKRVIDETGLCRDFPNVQKVVYCSAMQAAEKDFREALMEPIVAMAGSSVGVTKMVPQKWVRVREAIEAESERQNYLDRDRYHEICAENGVENEQTPALLSYFNNLGVCFSYHRDREKKELAAYKLLRPVWLTNAIYAVIEEGMAYARDGRIERSAVAQMLGNQAPRTVRGKQDYRRTEPTLVYTEEECRYVLDVAAVHDLCYAVDATTLFFPALCTNNTPQEALSEPTDYREHSAYCFQYSYSYLPDNVVHQLMIRCLRKGYTIDHSWLQGMVLGCLDEHRAIVRMVDGEKLRLDLYSKQDRRPYELFRVLRRDILEITRGLNLSCQEYLMQGEDSFQLATLLLDLEDGTEFKRGEKTHERVRIADLMAQFFDARTVRRMRIVDQSVEIGDYPWHRERRDNSALRRAIWEVYEKKCVYCGKMLTQAEIEIDHIYATNTPVVVDNSMRLYLDSLTEQGFDLTAPDYVENYLLSCKQSNDCKNNRPFSADNLRYYHDRAMQKTEEIIALKNKYQKGRRWSDKLEMVLMSDHGQGADPETGES